LHLTSVVALFHKNYGSHFKKIFMIFIHQIVSSSKSLLFKFFRFQRVISPFDLNCKYIFNCKDLSKTECETCKHYIPFMCKTGKLCWFWSLFSKMRQNCQVQKLHI